MINNEFDAMLFFGNDDETHETILRKNVVVDKYSSIVIIIGDNSLT
jgi:ATP adenylyltransferase/5',5'''-P-1,P-4-tetraphosphate phosphorylase II